MTPATRPRPPIVRLDDLRVGYGRDERRLRPAVQGVSIDVDAGEVVALVGESGSGKSTVALAVLGLLPAAGRITGGRIEVDGREVTGASERVRRGLRGRVVGFVPQDPMVGLNPTIRVGAQVAEAVRLRGVARHRVGVETLEALEQAGVDDPALRARQYPHQLSGGLRQRALIAIALAGRPRLLVADEPTSALDVSVQRQILDHVEGLVRSRGIGLLIITHDLAVALERADRVHVMKDGVIIEQGRPGDLFGGPRTRYTRDLLASAPGLRRDPDGTLAVRHAVADPPATGDPGADVPAPPVMRLTNVRVAFPQPGRGALVALDGVDLAVPRGRTLALVGESGSGKTTALRVALGLQRVSSGRIELDGQDLTGASWQRWRPHRRRVQLVHQNPYSALDPRFTVAECVAEPLVSFGVGDRRARRERVAELLHRVELPDTTASRLPAELSGGQRQRVAIARALALAPQLLLLDEPVSALDVSVQAQVLALLAGLQRDLGVSYLFVSHDLAVVADVAHHVAVLNRGRLVEEGPVATVLRRPRAAYTRLLLAAVPGRPRVLAGAVPADPAGVGGGVGAGAEAI